MYIWWNHIWIKQWFHHTQSVTFIIDQTKFSFMQLTYVPDNWTVIVNKSKGETVCVLPSS